MLSNSIFTNITQKKYPNEIDLYKDTIKMMSKIKKDISQFKQNNNSSDINISVFQDQKNINNLTNSYQESLILLDIMKNEIEKKLLQKYNIKIEEKNNNEKYTNQYYLNLFQNNAEKNEVYKNAINRDYQNNQKFFMKKKF